MCTGPTKALPVMVATLMAFPMSSGSPSVLLYNKNLTDLPKVLQLLCLPGGIFTTYPSLYMLNSFLCLSVSTYSPSLQSDRASLWDTGYKNNLSGSK